MIFNKTEGSELGVRVFIDGAEIPVTSVSVTSTDEEISTAQISLVPNKLFLKIKPRAMVHIFYLTTDTADDERLVQTMKLTVETYRKFCMRDNSVMDVRGKLLGSSRFMFPEDTSYKLLFVGEYLSYNFVKNNASRQISITCADGMNYLQFMKQHMANYKSGGYEMLENAFSGVASDKENKTPQEKDTKANLTKWIGNTKHYESKGTGNQGTSGGVHCTVTGIARAYLESWTVGNIFFSKALVRHRIPEMLVGLGNDRTGNNVFNIKEFKKFLDRRVAISGQGQQTPMLSVLQTVSQMVLMKRSSMLSPKFIQPNDTTNPYHQEYDSQKVLLYNDEVARLNEKSDGGGGLRYYYKAYRSFKHGAALNYFILSPSWWFFTPPACNVIFPDRYSAFVTARSFPDEITRLLLRTEEMVKGTGTPDRIAWERKMAPVYGGLGGSVEVIEQTLIKGNLSSRKYLVDRQYAPALEAFEALTNKSSGWKADLHRVLMPHEKYTGANVGVSWEAGMGGFGTKKERKKLISVLTDFTFWKTRFASRRGRLSGPINVHLAVGFPCLIIDKNEINPDENGMHHYGYVHSITHSFSQGGATTDVSLVGLRPYTENVDFQSEYDGKHPSEFQGFKDTVVAPLEKFWDERYTMSNISKDVYLPLLGTPCMLHLLAFLEEKESRNEALNEVLDWSIQNGEDFWPTEIREYLESSILTSAEAQLQEYLKLSKILELAPMILYYLYRKAEDGGRLQSFLRHFRRIGYASVVDMIGPPLDKLVDGTVPDDHMIEDVGFHFESLYSFEVAGMVPANGKHATAPEGDLPRISQGQHATYVEFIKEKTGTKKKTGKPTITATENRVLAEVTSWTTTMKASYTKLNDLATEIQSLGHKNITTLTSTEFASLKLSYSALFTKLGLTIKAGSERKEDTFKDVSKKHSYGLNAEYIERYKCAKLYADALKDSGQLE